MTNEIPARGLNYYFKIAIPIFIAASGLLSMSLIAYFLRIGTLPSWTISQFEIVNFTFTMQIMVLALSFIVTVLMYMYDRERFRIFFRLGFSSGVTSTEQQINWRLLGPLLAIVFTLGTTLLMSFGVSSENGQMNESFFKLLPLVLLFSAMNAWSEEIFSRFTIVAGLHGKLNPVTICWISAILFGVPHFFGTPSGVFGVIMSGLLGWLLAKSVIETKGMGWALLIHFLQDVVIFGAGAMIISGG
jgi:uncharacterized protein